ncbi:MAG: Mut7-C RNAse domain-containing protein [bacterium]|nr:Mut7-C RNAse domain-containing protein [bacterium]
MSGAPPAFIADHMLGRLARWLRIIGCDTAFSPRHSDAEIVRIARREGRIILTRDRGIADRRGAAGCILIGSQDYREQLREVARATGLEPDGERFFTRCPRCNRPVERIGAAEAAGKAPPYVLGTQREFSRCPECGRVFWRGSHHARALAMMREVFG